MLGHLFGIFKAFVKPMSLGALAALFVISSISDPALAQIRCERVHAPEKSYSLEWRVEKKTKDTVLDEDGHVDFLASGGALYIKDQPLSENSKVALMELIRMISATRAVKFSFKEFEGKEFGKLVLGVPLANKYSVEVTYKSDYREGQEPRFGAEEMRLITPAGKPEVIRKNLQNMEGGLAHDLSADLSDYPSIANLEIKLHIPSEISGEALATFSQVAPKLELLTKQELRDIAKTNNVLRLKALIHFRAFRTKVGEYLTKGYFKTIYKWTVAPLIGFGILFGANSIAPQQVDAARTMIKTAIVGSEERWLLSTLDRALDSSKIPDPVKAQVRELKMDFHKSLKAQSAVSPTSKQYSPDLNAQGKFQLSKDRYMWIQKTFDKEANREVVLMFVTQDNKYGQIEYAVTEIDPAKYQALIDFMQNRGGFMPVLMDGVQQ